MRHVRSWFPILACLIAVGVFVLLNSLGMAEASPDQPYLWERIIVMTVILLWMVGEGIAQLRAKNTVMGLLNLLLFVIIIGMLWYGHHQSQLVLEALSNVQGP